MNERSKILIVEDEKDIAELMSLHLKREGNDVTCVDNGEEAFKLLSKQHHFSLLVLDWMLPGVSGLELCKKIRGERAKGGANHLPILMVTARTHASDIVLGLEMGADDYLPKPFEIPVFLARVRALLRRASFVMGTDGEEPEPRQKIEMGNLVVDVESYNVTCFGKEIQLTPSEFKLLTSLIKNEGRVLTRERLIDLVKGEGVTVVDRSIDTHIFGLRKKLGKCSDIVETIRGVGYRVKAQ